MLPGSWNRSPTHIALSNDSVAENQSAGTVVGVLSTADLTVNDTFTYTLVDGDTTSFSLSGNSLKTAASFDYEACNTYTIRVRSTDQQGLWFEEEFTIAVTDVSE